MNARPARIKNQLDRITGALRGCYPKAVLLFGSAVAYLNDPQANPAPNDLDILMVGDNPMLGIDFSDIRPPVELLRFRVDQVTAVAKSLRYDSRPVALSKLYAKNVAKQHARDVIVASILLGSDYGAFGIEQIETDGRPDTRDYSLHKVLLGRSWWARLTAWARERRGPLRRFGDMVVMADEFE